MTRYEQSHASYRLNIHPSLQSRFAAHVKEWAGNGTTPIYPPGRNIPACTKCPLCQTRKNVVLYRGYLPCDVLFIGEAPGPSEDHDGYPFVGPAGEKFDQLWRATLLSDPALSHINDNDDALLLAGPRRGITNIVACMPRNPPETEWSEALGRDVALSTGTIRPPTKEEAAACSPRLLEIMALANPKLIVTLGQEAKRYLSKNLPRSWAETAAAQSANTINLLHPSAILRMSDEPSKQILAEKRFVLTLSDALRNL